MLNLITFKSIGALTAMFIVSTSIMCITGCSSTDGLCQIVDSTANIYIVNINAKTSTKGKPVTLDLNAGNYLVCAIGVTDGGKYNSWKCWFLREKQNKKGEWVIGWISKYSFNSEEFAEVTVYDNKIYGTPLEALQNAKDSQFTLHSRSKVNFYILDSPYFDNSGGISLKITPMPKIN